MFYCAICAGVSWGMVALKNVLCVGGGSGLGERIYLGYKLFLSNRNG